MRHHLPEQVVRANRGHAFPMRAFPEIRFWVAEDTGLCRPATHRTERGARPEAIKTGLLKEAASVFRSASCPCYPFSGHALISRGCD